MKSNARVKWKFLIALLIYPLSIPLHAVLTSEPANKCEVTDDEEAGKTQPSLQYIEVSIHGPYVEAKSPFPFSQTPKTIRGLTSELESIRENENAIGVLLKIGNLGTGWAKLQEMRDKIIQLRESGKVVISHLNGGGNMEYLLACAADRIYLTPTGTVGLTGLRAEVMFYAGLFEKLDVEAEMIAIGKFKSVVEPFTQKQMSEPFREAVNTILDDLHSQQIDMISGGRTELDDAVVAQLIDGGPFTGGEALDNRLVDGLLYYDELLASVQSESAKPIEVVTDSAKESKEVADLTGFGGLMRLFSMLSPPRKDVKRPHVPRIAIIYAAGPILSDVPDSPFNTGQIITPRELTEALRQIRTDDSVIAAVMRIDSPGGSALASDLIWREVFLTQQEKPVVVSMSDVAGSGGYYIAMAAGAIVAQPASITGSIGVVGGKLNLKGLYNKLGLTKEVITRGKNANIYSDYGRFTMTERERVEKLMNTVYEDFVRKAADGRDMTEEEIHEIAQGRVWTGKQAVEIGLVDVLGGLDTALSLAKAEAGLKVDDEVEVFVLPKPKTFLELFVEDLEQNLSIPRPLNLSVPASIAPSLTAIYRLLAFANEPVATVLPIDLEIR
ncbi:MAG: signal peptide peptidase SppA [Candidatus Poribacteria bacterium]|nr:signal peptide peptidase SppA [Candidatus Poribacteria bacterium]MDE0506446.1 signal peptide peptidase SppA [Candidatus Poribacteria bacterium]